MARPVTRSFSSASVASFEVGGHSVQRVGARQLVGLDRSSLQHVSSNGSGWNVPGSRMDWQFCQSHTRRVAVTFEPLRNAGGFEFPL